MSVNESADGLLRNIDGSPITNSQLSQVLYSLHGEEAEITDIEIISETLQGGSHSGVLRLLRPNGAAPENIFLKKITASHAPMSKRSWHDRRKTLAYARTESRFYGEFISGQDISTRLARFHVRLPRLIFSDNRLDLVLGDSKVHESAGDEPSLETQASAGAILFLECAGSEYIQSSPLSFLQAKQALRAVAGLHAAFWEDSQLLSLASERLQRHGGVYALEIRNPAEIAKIMPNWDHFVSEFRSMNEAFFLQPNVRSLGQRLDKCARIVSQKASPSPTDRYATLIHGDFKAMNVFIPTSLESDAMLIDFAGIGVGLGMSDVAMLLIHSVDPSTLDDGGQGRLIDIYLEALKENGILDYDKAVAMHHFHIGVLDYARFVISRFWSDASETAFLKRASNPNVCLPNRNVIAALRFIERIDKSLAIIEPELEK